MLQVLGWFIAWAGFGLGVYITDGVYGVHQRLGISIQLLGSIQVLLGRPLLTAAFAPALPHYHPVALVQVASLLVFGRISSRVHLIAHIAVFLSAVLRVPGLPLSEVCRPACHLLLPNVMGTNAPRVKVNGER